MSWKTTMITARKLQKLCRKANSTFLVVLQDEADNERHPKSQLSQYSWHTSHHHQREFSEFTDYLHVSKLAMNSASRANFHFSPEKSGSAIVTDLI
jgi:hypothetical protein